MRWGSAAALIALSGRLQAALEARKGGVPFPLLVLHDPGDRITGFVAAAKLAAESPAATLHPLPGGLHDLLANEPEALATAVLHWLCERAAKLAPAE
jgi:pimeloyl-ACP methyl ester carboxylesterase